jgi:hypothetical protein
MKSGKTARPHTVAATDTLWAAWIAAGIDVHFTNLGASPAMDAFRPLQPKLAEGDFIEESIKSAQRAEYFAEKAINRETADKGSGSDCQLQSEEPSNGLY